jgi:hypothetical protein
LEIEPVETFGEPAINTREEIVSLGAPTLVASKPRESCDGATLTGGEHDAFRIGVAAYAAAELPARAFEGTTDIVRGARSSSLALYAGFQASRVFTRNPPTR